MGDLTWLFNGTDGETPTAASLGITTLFATNGTAKLLAAAAFEGSTGLSLINGANQPAFARVAPDSTTAVIGAHRWYVKEKALPASGAVYWQYTLAPNGANSTRLLNVRLHSDGRVSVLDNSNSGSSATTVPSWGYLKAAGSTTTDLVLAADTYYRYEVQWEINTTTAAGGYWAVQIFTPPEPPP